MITARVVFAAVVIVIGIAIFVVRRIVLRDKATGSGA